MEVGECLFPIIVVHFQSAYMVWVSRLNISWFILQTQKLRNGINDLELPRLRVELMLMAKWLWNWMKCTCDSFVVVGVFDIYIPLSVANIYTLLSLGNLLWRNKCFSWFYY
jgi:hypothetical protein